MIPAAFRVQSKIREIRSHSSFLIRLGLLAAGFASFLAGQTPARHVGSEVTTIDLDSHPEGQILASAKNAFVQGDIIRIIGGTPNDLQRLLGIGGATVSQSAVLEDADNRLRNRKITKLVYQIVAARATATGALHEFLQLGPERIGRNSGDAFPAYDDWAAKEGRLAEEEQSGSFPTDPTPPSHPAWTQLQQVTYSSQTPSGNVFQNTVSVFRLDDIKPDHDWYMVVTDPQSQPNFQGCKVFGTGSCGWWTTQRIFSMATSPQFTLYDNGPANTITTSAGSFSIGANLTTNAAGVIATYVETWQQPSVVTTNESDLTKGLGRWNEKFQDLGIITPPPATSTELFQSHQGSIFQVPEGTTSFKFTLSGPVISEFQPHFGNPSLETVDSGYFINVVPPVFAVSVNSVSIPAGGSGGFAIAAVNPSTSNGGVGLAWQITNIPDWLTVSQTTGSSSTRITLNVKPGTLVGSVASINVDTNPQFAAPSVEENPLLVRVTVGQPSETGVMFTGGNNTQGPENIASIYNPQSGQFDFETTMQSPRTNHTATLLASGDLLVAGGLSGQHAVLGSAELFSAGHFAAAAGMMADSREMHTATLLQNGKVLLAGGVDNTGVSSGDAVASAEIYDADSQQFTATGSMSMARAGHSATLLLDGTVLIAGGQPLISLSAPTNTAEIYNAATGQFTRTAGNLLVGVYNHTATLLKNGQVLIVGGAESGGGVSAAAELYNPATKTFSAVGNLNVARQSHAATLLSDGTVLITGGLGSTGYLASAEIYNPETQTFALLSGSANCPGGSGCMTTARASHTATLLPDGTVLLAFGNAGQNILGSTEIFDPKTRSFTAGASSTPRVGQTATLLERTATTVSLTSSLNPSAKGQKITLTATVASEHGAPPTGSVTFQDGASPLGTVDLQPSNKGIATLTTDSLSAGPHSLTAIYGGDGTHSKNTSSILVQTVNPQATTISLRSSQNPSELGRPVTFTATVLPKSFGTPTGAVVFRNNGTELSTVPLTDGTAAFTAPSLGPGDNSITATYSGDSNFAGSTSPVLTQRVIGLVTPTVVLKAQPNVVTFGKSVTFTATVSYPGGPTPTGSITVSEATNGAQVYGIAVLKNGVGVVKSSDLPVGPHNLIATYGGDGGVHYTGAQSSSVPVSVNAPRQ